MQTPTKTSLGKRSHDEVAGDRSSCENAPIYADGPLSFEDYRQAMVRAGHRGNLVATTIVALLGMYIAHVVQADLIDGCVFVLVPVALHLVVGRLFSTSRLRNKYCKEPAILCWQILDAGIKQTWTTGEWVVLPFQRVTGVDTTKRFAVLRSSPNNYVVPKAAFATENDWKVFMQLLTDESAKLPVREPIQGEVILRGPVTKAEADLMVAIARQQMGIFGNGGLLLISMLLSAMGLAVPIQNLFRGGPSSSAFVGALICVLCLFAGMILFAFWSRIPELIRGQLSTFSEWSISQTGVVVQRNGVSSGIPWNSIIVEEIRDEGLLLRRIDGSEILLPRSCFLDEHEWRLALGYAEKSTE